MLQQHSFSAAMWSSQQQQQQHTNESIMDEEMTEVGPSSQILQQESFLYSELLRDWDIFRRYCANFLHTASSPRQHYYQHYNPSVLTHTITLLEQQYYKHSKYYYQQRAYANVDVAPIQYMHYNSAAAAATALLPTETITLFTSLDMEKRRELLEYYTIEGPNWVVFLLANTADESRVRIHTIVGITNLDPDTVETIFNDASYNNYRQTHRYIGHWVIILATSGFSSYDSAKEFFKLMHADARGIASRAAKCLAMYELFRKHQPNLRLFCVNMSKIDKELAILHKIEQRQQVEQQQYQQYQQTAATSSYQHIVWIT